MKKVLKNAKSISGNLKNNIFYEKLNEDEMGQTQTTH